MEVLTDILWQSWLVLGQMAPYLLLGFLVAGVLSVCVSAAWVERHLGGPGLYPVGAASLLGVPLPLCSCGVIPVSASIRRHGASRGATTAFLISTPQTGVDSIAVTYAMLGPVFAVFRPVAALITGVVGGVLAQLADRSPDDPTGNRAGPQPTCGSGCTGDADVDNADGGGRSGASRENVVARALRYGFVTLPRDIGSPLLVGVGIAGLIGALVEPNQLEPWLGAGVWSILLVMAAAVPLYVCATASVPIAVGLIHLGASPGAALAFLIAGPATNAATITTIWRLVGRRVTLTYLATVGTSAVVGGLVLDALLPGASLGLPGAEEHLHEVPGGLPGHLWAGALLAVLLFSYVRLVWHKPAHEPESSRKEDGTMAAEDAPGRRVKLHVTGMTCSHCADAVRRTLGERPGARQAEVDLDAGTAVVVGENGLDADGCVTAVRQLGYGAEMVGGGQ